MSNHLAIATVTAALGQLVHTSAQEAVSGVSLELGRPVAQAGGVTERKVFVYLFQITPNAALRNADLPTRASSGELVNRPQAAIDLHYLLTFVGDDRLFEPQRMLGAVARDLHARPILSRAAIENAIASHAELAGSDLASSVERVKLTPEPLPLEEMSKLWSVMIQTPYALSVLYQASMVFLDARQSAPAALPVLQRGEGDRGVDTRIGPFPQLEAFWFGAADALARVPRPVSLPNAELGAVVAASGANLGGDAITWQLQHQRRAVTLAITASNTASDARELLLALPDDAAAQDAWAAGKYDVSLAVKRGASVRTSQARELRLAPRITALTPNPAPRDAGGAVTLTLTCRPKLRPEQTIVLALGRRELSPQPLAAASDSVSFVIDAAPVLDATLLRLRVDDVESQPFHFDAVSGSFVFDDAQRITIT